MKKIIILISFLAIAGAVFAQDNLKVIDYKILKFDKDNYPEYTVPENQVWRIEGMVAREACKIEFTIDGDLYLIFWFHEWGPSDQAIPFYLPAKTKFTMKPQEKIAISIAVLKIE